MEFKITDGDDVRILNNEREFTVRMVADVGSRFPECSQKKPMRSLTNSQDSKKDRSYDDAIFATQNLVFIIFSLDIVM